MSNNRAFWVVVGPGGGGCCYSSVLALERGEHWRRYPSGCFIHRGLSRETKNFSLGRRRGNRRGRIEWDEDGVVTY